jgi:hypothetical protein
MIDGEFLNRISQAWAMSENSQEPFAVTFGLDLDGAEKVGLDWNGESLRDQSQGEQALQPRVSEDHYNELVDDILRKCRHDI